MSKTFVGIDNGVTGSIGIIYPDGTSAFIETPVYKTQSYTQKNSLFTGLNGMNYLTTYPLIHLFLSSDPWLTRTGLLQQLRHLGH